jgi:hypothetical protein
LHRERERRETRARGRRFQRWFRDSNLDATTELRRLVGDAAKLVWVADPYFEGDDVLRVLAAVKDPGVPIWILAGAEHLRSRPPGGVERGESLERRISEAQAPGHMSPIEVRVMPGEKPLLHDRFLLVDEALWMLGSSLNAFGTRGTMIIRVPDAEPVLADLKGLWADAKNFDEWLSNRRQGNTDGSVQLRREC